MMHGQKNIKLRYCCVWNIFWNKIWNYIHTML